MKFDSSKLAEQRSQVIARLEELVAVTQGDEARALTEEEAAEFDTLEAKAEELRKDIERVEKAEAIRPTLRKSDVVEEVAPQESPEARVGKQSLTYERGGQNSYLADLIAVRSGDPGAADRLRRHADEYNAERGEVRAINTTAGSGGNFAPPLWLNEQYVSVARAGRPLANIVNRQTLPMGYGSITIPKITGGTSEAVQATEGSNVSSTDITDTTISLTPATIAGEQTVSQQLFDRSVPGIQDVLLDDLTRAYATQVDSQVLNGSGSSGQVKGVLNVSSTSASTYTAGTPTAAGLYSKVADVLQQIASNRYLPADFIAMHPRRWGWLEAQVDGNGRPLVVPVAGAFNPMGVDTNEAAQSFTGTLQGVPVLLDANIPTNLGSGTNEDRVIAGVRSDLWLFEEDGGPRVRILDQTNGHALQLVVQVYGYVAFTGERYAKSIGIVSGTGLATPTF